MKTDRVEDVFCLEPRIFDLFNIFESKRLRALNLLKIVNVH